MQIFVLPSKSWKNHPQKLLRKTQIHFFPLLPAQPKWPKQKNSCSKMWPIDQLYIELGRKLYDNFHIFLFQKRIVSAETIYGNIAIWCKLTWKLFWRQKTVFNYTDQLSICSTCVDFSILFLKQQAGRFPIGICKYKSYDLL